VWEQGHGPSFYCVCERNTLTGLWFSLRGPVIAWKKGIPERIKERSSTSYAVLLPEIPDHLDKDTVTFEDADYLMLEVSK